jgi:hypothetical protein
MDNIFHNQTSPSPLSHDVFYFNQNTFKGGEAQYNRQLFSKKRKGVNYATDTTCSTASSAS